MEVTAAVASGGALRGHQNLWSPWKAVMLMSFIRGAAFKLARDKLQISRHVLRKEGHPLEFDAPAASHMGKRR
jgi:hypothetical protein